ncbi:hypothetical protein EU522_01500 [Candidatus Thorarchaeota archaeon]|nr:MAG: hypothetical protein EU522_01500 [Candidatus Thorarchaeota archaeon]
MLEVKTIPIIEKVINQIKAYRRKRIEATPEHPDLREIRRNRAAEEALRDLERAKIASRSYAVRS